jgi:diguanylate cyclase (GGDEF)-like protein/PAS domain S-box-containing protein
MYMQKIRSLPNAAVSATVSGRKFSRSINVLRISHIRNFIAVLRTLDKSQKRLFAASVGAYLGAFAASLQVAIASHQARPLGQDTAVFTLVSALCVAFAALGAVLILGTAALTRERLRLFDLESKKTIVADELQQEIEERRILFDTSKNLIIIVDDYDSIVRVTPSSQSILGFAPSELVGKNSLLLLVETDRPHAEAEMRQVKADAVTRFFDARLAHKCGREVVIAWSCAWSQSERKYFCIGRDRTEIIERESVISEQNLKLDLALSNMSQGLLMIDVQGRVQLANGQFAATFGLDKNTIGADATVSDLECLVRNTKLIVPTNDESVFEKFIGDRAEKFESVSQWELTDGRTINVKVSPLKAGGALGTFEDITDLQMALKTLALKNATLANRELELQVKHLQLDAAINNMNQGLSMFDSQGRLILCNDQALTMHGISRDDVNTGMTIADISAIRIASGVASPELTDKAIEAYTAAFSDPNPSSFVVQLHNGAMLSVNCQSMLTGGWVITHRDVTLERQREAKIVHLARHDTLTDLPNRVVLGEVLATELTRCLRGQKAALHFIDLDGFKSVNDTLGHAVGDKLLLAVAERLRACVRSTDTVVRLGGDEFAIVQSDIKSPEDATRLAKQLIAELCAPYEIDGSFITRGASIGIALAPDDGTSSEDLLKHSDLALYRAKELGRGDYQFFEPALNAKMQKRREIEADLRQALALDQFELHYQPLVSVTAGKIKSAEALIRWRHPDRGLVPPLEFISIAEETGLIHSIGEWVVREACMQASHWPDDIRVAVNLSPLQFRRAGLAAMVADALSQSKLKPQRLELEVTESLLLDANSDILKVLEQFRDIGVGIALDDFGTGYSSLSYLQSFPFTKLKIDRSFIKNLGVQQSSRDIVTAIVAMAKALKMSVTAEGIETQQQFAAAIEAGCTEFQGYLFSRPLPASELSFELSIALEGLLQAA